MEPYQFVLVGLLVALAAVGLLSSRAGRRRADRLYAERGVDVVGWVVQANGGLGRPGRDDLPAFVLFTFDPRAADAPGLMSRLANRLAELKTREPAGPAEVEVAKWVRDEWFPLRAKVPPEVAGGYEVYYCLVMVVRKLLPGGVLSQPTVPLRAVPGDAGGVPRMAAPGRPADDADDLIARIR